MFFSKMSWGPKLLEALERLPNILVRIFLVVFLALAAIAAVASI
jgi:hypothetical protein